MYILLVYTGAEKNPVFSFLHPLTKIYIISLRQNDFERRRTDHRDVLTSLITASSGPPQPSGLPRKPVPQRRSSPSPKSPHHQAYRRSLSSTPHLSQLLGFPSSLLFYPHTECMYSLCVYVFIFNLSPDT